MKRGRKKVGDKITETGIKSTYLLDPNLKKHIIVASLVLDMDQSDILREALADWFSARGVDVTKPPQLPNYQAQ